MAKGLNTVIITGYIHQEPEVREVAGSRAVISFSVGYDASKYNAATSEWTNATHWFSAQYWVNNTDREGVLEKALDKLRAGTTVTVSGKLVQNTWTTDSGEKKSRISITVHDIVPSEGLSRAKTALADIEDI